MVKVSQELKKRSAEIEAAIQRAEVGSCGEVIVVVSRMAGIYSWQEAVISFLVSLGCLSLAWWRWQGIEPTSPAPWDTGPVIVFHRGYVLLTLVLGFLLGQVLVRAFPRILCMFASKRSMRRHAERAAALSFRRYRVSETARNTGVMLFIAEMEQTVVVMGDDHISEHITTHQWEAIRDAILDGIRERRPVEGLVSALELTGDLLRTHCPQQDEAIDELPSKLYFR